VDVNEENQEAVWLWDPIFDEYGEETIIDEHILSNVEGFIMESLVPSFDVEEVVST
jgi:hypothetical protein